MPVRDLKNGGKGKILVNCTNEKAKKEVIDIAVQKLGDINNRKLRDPIMKINGIEDKYEDNELIAKLKKQNEILANSELKVLSNKEIKGKRNKYENYNVSIQIDIKSWKALASNNFKINLG